MTIEVKRYLLLIFILCISLVNTAIASSEEEILFFEDFRYESVDELKDSGWVILGSNPSRISVEDGYLNVYPGGYASLKRKIILPSDFVVEVRARSPDNSRIFFSISKEGESIMIDDNPDENFIRVAYHKVGMKNWPGEIVYISSEMLTDLREFQTYRIEVHDGEVKVYKNDEFIGRKFIESFRDSGVFVFYTTSFWNTRFQIDYIKISGQISEEKLPTATNLRLEKNWRSENSSLLYPAILTGIILSAYSLRRFYVSFKNDVILGERYLLRAFFVSFFTIGILHPEPVLGLLRYIFSIFPHIFKVVVVSSIIAGALAHVIVEILFYPSNKKRRYGAVLFAILCTLMFQLRWGPSLLISVLLSTKVPKSWIRGVGSPSYYNVLYTVLAILYFLAPIFIAFAFYHYKLSFVGLFSPSAFYTPVIIVETPPGQPNLAITFAKSISNPYYFFPKGLIAFVLFIGTFYHTLTKESFYATLILIFLSIISPFIGYYSPVVYGIVGFFAGKACIKILSEYRIRKEEYERLKMKLIREMDEFLEG